MKFQSTLIFAALLTTGFFEPAAVGAAEPPARFWHSFSGNGNEAAGASRLYVFGGDSGYSAYKNLNDLWYYRADTQLWTLAPTGRTKPVLVMVSGGRAVAVSVWLPAAVM